MSLGRFLTISIISIGFVPVTLFAATNYTANDNAASDGLTRYGEFVMESLLKDMSLALPDEDKTNPDEEDVEPVPNNDDPEPQPQPQPQPRPQPDRDDSDFFGDDDFFDDDRGFDDVVDDFDREFEETVNAWDKEYEETVARWDRARQQYNQEKENLANVTYDMAEFANSATAPNIGTASTSSARSLSAMQPGDYHVIPYAFNIDIRNQVGRGTCAAFAGVRALETVLWQHQDMRSLQIDLSEQHFYWLSKEPCRSTPCTEDNANEGSWSDNGFAASQGSTRESALMLERGCPYNPYPNSDNLSYTPLNNCDFNGLFRTGRFHQYLTLDQVIAELSRNRPVVAGFTLTNSYKETKGLVRARDPLNKTAASGKHVPGHAMVLIGYIKLPEKYWREEGEFCAIMANSWGVGFGVGGYACLTKQWMLENQFKVESGSSRGLFTSVEAVEFLR